MNKRIFILLVAAIMVTAASCTENKETTASSSPVSSVSSQSSEESKTESMGSTDYLMMRSFGELWMCDTFYIDVNMTVEKKQETNGEDSKSSKTSETSSQKPERVNYSFIIAADRVNGTASLTMASDVGNLSQLLKDGYLYTFNHGNKTYTKTLYSGTVDDFGSQYTTSILLGSVNNCVFEEKGTTTFADQQVTYEKYKVTASEKGTVDQSLGNVYSTYYFDSKGIPVAQIIESDTGTTTFTFNRIQEQIAVVDIFEIPEGYKEVSE